MTATEPRRHTTSDPTSYAAGPVANGADGSSEIDSILCAEQSRAQWLKTESGNILRAE